MMRPHTLKEFAENLRITGDYREVEFATEILDLLDLEADVAEPYSTLCYDIEQYAKDFSNPDDASKALEWLGDRSNLLAEIEEKLRDADRAPTGTSDTADAVREMISTLGEAEDILEAAGWPGGSDFIAGIEALVQRPAPPEYDL